MLMFYLLSAEDSILRN